MKYNFDDVIDNDAPSQNSLSLKQYQSTHHKPYLHMYQITPKYLSNHLHQTSFDNNCQLALLNILRW